MPLETTRRASAIGDAAAQLERMITSGEWQIGARIPAEAELMEQLGVGRNSLREAIRALVHTGLLRTRQGDGTYVRASSGLSVALQRYAQGADAHYVLEARRGLEREAARLAATRRTEEDLAALDDAMVRQRRAIDVGDRNALEEADVEFHRVVMVAAHNPVMTDLLSHLGGTIDHTVRSLIDSGSAHTDPRGLRVHIDLAEAIRVGRPQAAAEAADALLDWITHAWEDSFGQ
jgi:DNA-binding FadR family transcriptional regulator